MKIAQIGNGSMGKAIISTAQEKGHSIAAIIERKDEITEKSLNDADIAIECTLPDSIMDNIKKLSIAKQDTVIVTTGWYDKIDAVRRMVEESGIRCIYSTNYSIGVNIYFRVLGYAAQWINKFEEYDIRATEVHHKNKVDSPSGTAKMIADILLKNIDRKTSIVEETLHRKRKDSEIHFSSNRGGLSNFQHSVFFDSPTDSIELNHRAINRDGYASGVLQCAQWLLHQEPGLYTMADFLEDVLKNEQ